MNKDKIKELDYINVVSTKTHPSLDEDSRFYRKFKAPLSLTNPTVTYRKHRVKLLSYKWNEQCQEEDKEKEYYDE